jgi:hypothetical protein
MNIDFSKLQHRLALGAGALALSASICLPAQAVSLVNGGFETGDLTGWTTAGLLIGSDSGVVDASYSLPIYDGTYSFASGPVAGPGTLSQSLAVVPSATYTLTFYLANLDSAGGPSSFSVQLGSTTFSLPNNFIPFSYSKFTVVTVATGPTLGLTFSFYNVPSFWMLDDAVLTGPTPVPEPETWALMGAGVLGVGFMAVRRRRQG